jgi:hypothetical protein
VQVKSLLMTAVVAIGTLVSGSACQRSGTSKDCDVTYAGIAVVDGLVTDVVRAACDVPPQRHTMQVQIEFEVGGLWVPQGRAVTKSAIPDRAGYTLRAQAPCQQGNYRTHVRVEGIGPQGNPFTFDDAGQPIPIALVQCAK